MLSVHTSSTSRISTIFQFLNICFRVLNSAKLRIWVSTNAGISWLPSTTLLDNGVLVNEPLTFYPREPAQEEMRKVKRWLLAHAVNGDLYSSLNGGLSWSLVASNVLNAKWGTPLDSVDAVYLLTLEKGSISSDG